MSTLPEMEIDESHEDPHSIHYEIWPWGRQPFLVASIRVFRPYGEGAYPFDLQPSVIVEGSHRFNIEQAKRQRDALDKAIDLAESLMIQVNND